MQYNLVIYINKHEALSILIIPILHRRKLRLVSKESWEIPKTTGDGIQEDLPSLYSDEQYFMINTLHSFLAFTLSQ